jgi:hypothetical protein
MRSLSGVSAAGASFAAIQEMLYNDDPRVRIEDCYVLACDRCEDKGWRPDAAAVLSKAIEIRLRGSTGSPEVET